jgi:hypothetical protein
MKHILLIAVIVASACTTTYDYDSVNAGDPDGTHQLQGKTSSQFVRGVFADLLGRSPESWQFTLKINGQTQFQLPIDEETEIVNTLDGLGDSLPLRNLLVAGLLHSSEITIPDKTAVPDPRAYIKDQFNRLLGRDPNTYELETFAAQWQTDPAVGPRAVIRAIVGSREYQSQ